MHAQAVLPLTEILHLTQDSEGCRLSFVNGTWRFEAAGMPTIIGNSQGVTVEPCPGVQKIPVHHRCPAQVSQIEL
jgi:hypothetical protein